MYDDIKDIIYVIDIMILYIRWKIVNLFVRELGRYY